MRVSTAAALLGACALATHARATPLTSSPKIDTIVVVMMENRAFDHMLGYMARGGPFGDERVDGLNGTECNAKSLAAGGACTQTPFSSVCLGPNARAAAAAVGIVCANDKAADRCEYDPNHTHGATTERIFGCKYSSHDDANGTTPCTNHASVASSPTMTGFTQSAVWEGRDGENEMSMWPSEKVPIITTLAKEFANFDRFFCSHPGPTYPNRQFVHSGTAFGETDDEVPSSGFPQKTLFRQLEENNLEWKMYYEDSLAWAIFLDDLRRNESKPNLQEMSAFYQDAANGDLPAYSFIEPRIAASRSGNATSNPSFGLANHQHPVASVREGERLMKNMYEALRKGPKWNSTLFIVTYDEHGGFFDHVPPPQTGVPNPDGKRTVGGFNFTRLGIRIPTIAISPWIEKGVLVHEAPTQQKPQPTSQWELSSIPATVQKLFGLKGPSLTARTAWAATFEHLLTRTTPRTDCPMELPDIPPPAEGELARQLALPIDEHARGVIKMLCDMVGGTADAGTQAPAAEQAEQQQQQQQRMDARANLDLARRARSAPYSASAAAADQHCADLGICLPRGGAAAGCGAGISTNEQFSEFRARMWRKWMQM